MGCETNQPFCRLAILQMNRLAFLQICLFTDCQFTETPYYLYLALSREHIPLFFYRTFIEFRKVNLQRFFKNCHVKIYAGLILANDLDCVVRLRAIVFLFFIVWKSKCDYKCFTYHSQSIIFVALSIQTIKVAYFVTSRCMVSVLLVRILMFCYFLVEKYYF